MYYAIIDIKNENRIMISKAIIAAISEIAFDFAFVFSVFARIISASSIIRFV